MSSPSPIPERRLLPDGPTLSLLGVTVLPPPTPGAATDRSVVERLRRTRRSGLLTFDVAGSPDPRRSERLLATAFPEKDPHLMVIVGRTLEDLVHREGGTPLVPDALEGVGERLRDSIGKSERRLAPNRVGIVEWSGEGLPSAREWEVATGPSGPPPPYLGWRLKAGNVSFPPEFEGREPPLITSGSLSLLDSRLAAALEERSGRRPISFLAREVFAGGLLDGTRASFSGMERGPGAGPVRLRDLQEEFGPVLRLARLTDRHRRTMAQAAIRYSAHWPWVSSVLVPLPTVDRLDEVLQTFDTPPFTEEELRLIRPANPVRAGATD